MREKDQTTVEEYDCEHEAMIERLQEMIKRKWRKREVYQGLKALFGCLLYRKGRGDRVDLGANWVVNCVEGPRNIQL